MRENKFAKSCFLFFCVVHVLFLFVLFLRGRKRIGNGKVQPGQINVCFYVESSLRMKKTFCASVNIMRWAHFSFESTPGRWLKAIKKVSAFSWLHVSVFVFFCLSYQFLKVFLMLCNEADGGLKSTSSRFSLFCFVLPCYNFHSHRRNRNSMAFRALRWFYTTPGRGTKFPDIFQSPVARSRLNDFHTA